MAQQDGIIKLKGRVGDLTFYKTRNGYQARQRSGIDGNRIATDPRFKRTRENCAEFGRAGKAGKLFRTVFKTLTSTFADSYVSNRLTKLMLQVVKADAVNTRGERKVLDAETEMLKGFEFNLKGEVNRVLYMPYQSQLNRSSGTGELNLEAFSARDQLTKPQGATHFKFILALASVDFESQAYELKSVESSLMMVDDVHVDALQLNCVLDTVSTNPMFLLLGINFYQEVNGELYPLLHGTFNALSVVDVLGL